MGAFRDEYGELSAPRVAIAAAAVVAAAVAGVAIFGPRGAAGRDGAPQAAAAAGPHDQTADEQAAGRARPATAGGRDAGPAAADAGGPAEEPADVAIVASPTGEGAEAGDAATDGWAGTVEAAPATDAVGTDEPQSAEPAGDAGEVGP